MVGCQAKSGQPMRVTGERLFALRLATLDDTCWIEPVCLTLLIPLDAVRCDAMRCVEVSSACGTCRRDLESSRPATNWRGWLKVEKCPKRKIEAQGKGKKMWLSGEKWGSLSGKSVWRPPFFRAARSLLMFLGGAARYLADGGWRAQSGQNCPQCASSRWVPGWGQLGSELWEIFEGPSMDGESPRREKKKSPEI